MSRLLARIMLALLMLPAAAVLYTGMVAMAFELGGRNEERVFGIATVVITAFVGAYWTALWRRTITWTPQRVRRTGGSIAAAVGAGTVVCFLGFVVDESFGIFLGGITAIVLGLILTTLAWRETATERAARVSSSGVTQGVACPTCGYNMTGLRQAICPECGASFTLDEFMALQAGREEDELRPEAEG